MAPTDEERAVRAQEDLELVLAQIAKEGDTPRLVAAREEAYSRLALAGGLSAQK